MPRPSLLARKRCVVGRDCTWLHASTGLRWSVKHDPTKFAMENCLVSPVQNKGFRNPQQVSPQIPPYSAYIHVHPCTSTIFDLRFGFPTKCTSHTQKKNCLLAFQPRSSIHGTASMQTTISICGTRDPNMGFESSLHIAMASKI